MINISTSGELLLAQAHTQAAINIRAAAATSKGQDRRIDRLAGDGSGCSLPRHPLVPVVSHNSLSAARRRLFALFNMLMVIKQVFPRRALT